MIFYSSGELALGLLLLATVVLLHSWMTDVLSAKLSESSSLTLEGQLLCFLSPDSSTMLCVGGRELGRTAGGSCHSLAPSECQAFHVEMISSPGQSREEAICFPKRAEGLGSEVWWRGLEPRSLGLKNLEFFLRAVGSRVVWSALCSPSWMQGDYGPHGITSISSVLQTFLVMSSQVAWAPRSLSQEQFLWFSSPGIYCGRIGGWLC